MYMEEVIEQYKDAIVVLAGMAAVFCILTASIDTLRKIVEGFMLSVFFR